MTYPIEFAMRTIANIPEHIRDTFTIEEREAIELLTPWAMELKIFYQYETGEFDCIGFISDSGKVTKFGDVEKYKALTVLENRVRRELRNEIGKLQ